MRSRQPNRWQNLNDRQLINLRVCELGLDFDSSIAGKLKSRLYRELARSGLPNLKPKIYFGDEWYSPDRTVAISIPFYLADGRLSQLLNRYGHAVEGETSWTVMRYLRHEAGHAFDHAFAISEMQVFRRVFGNPNVPYIIETKQLLPDPHRFVRNLAGNYAQTHPLEDFAETFAVWLNPRSNWQRRFKARSPAGLKLRLVHSLVAEFSAQEISRPRGPAMTPANSIRKQLRKFCPDLNRSNLD